MLYRPYSPGDFPHLYAIEELCFEPPLRFSRAYLRQLIESPRSATWVAEHQGEIAGFAVVEWETLQDSQLAYIQTLEVKPQLRRMGAGRELLQRVEASAGSACAEEIWLHVDVQNTPAIHLYEAYGYHCEGREEHYYARGRAALIYRKAFQ